MADSTHSAENERTQKTIQAGIALARRHQEAGVTTAASAAIFKAQLARQQSLLKEARDYFRSAAGNEPITYAGEWLLDNFYIIRRAARQIVEDLPERYYRQLPGLADAGPLTAYPRIFALARHLLLAEEGALDLDEVRTFIHGYQQVQPLTMGELWALPIMLRVVLLESLAQAAGRLASLPAAGEGSPAFHLPYEVADADLIAAIVPALHRLENNNWKDYFESVSLVERQLAADPAGLYRALDFETRDRYRNAVETLAQASGASELAVAEQAVSLAAQVAAEAGQVAGDAPDGYRGLELPRKAHVGYYLLDDGCRRLEQAVGFKPVLGERLRRWFFAHATLVYLGSIMLLLFLLLAATQLYAASAGGALWQRLLLLFLFFVPALSVAVDLVNWVVTQTVEPHVLPKLDFSEGIPAAGRAMVVIPAMLTSDDEVDSLLGQLERHYLRNSDPNLGFALLTDFADADAETLPEDEALLERAQNGLAALNAGHPGSPFYLFHRRRLWNPQEGVWMGWERKRGKLHEFNRLLRGDRDTSYMMQEGDLSFLPAVRYVITLDADTILPRESAARLVGTIAHPLNRARFASTEAREVVAGYTVLQPRTEIQPASANQSAFTRIFAGDTGLDLYTLAVSDVYQDLFGEGIFVGKGIYDVDAFERTLVGRVPENALLSHDLFEGVHGRAGLVTDVVLYEDYPPHYLIQVRRSHRWVRGDWQLLPWLLPRVPLAGGGRVPNPLSFLDRWKIADNLRRSLLAVFLILYFLAAWTVLPGSALLWTVLGVLVPAVSVFTSLAHALVRGVGEAGWATVWRPVRDAAFRWLFYLAFLPYEAALNLDAILTTIGRVWGTRRHLLQWTTAAHTVRLFGDEVSADVTWRNMASSLLLSLALSLIVVLADGAVLVALPLVFLWLFSPQLAHRVSRPDRRRPGALPAGAERRLRRLARQTWFFYEQFVGPEDNWLPPDHFQEEPKGVVAHRTSPTNSGLYMLSALAAYDFGYIDLLGLSLRWQSTLDTFSRLDRHRGHFLNWIDTRTLAPLPPRYVSTVDSGNLAGCLIVVQQAARHLPEEPAWRSARWQGLLDALDLLEQSVTEVASPETARPFVDDISTWRREVLAIVDKPERWPRLLANLHQQQLPALDQELVAAVESAGGAVPASLLQDCRFYMGRVHEQVQAMVRQMELFLPWLLLLEASPTLLARADAPSSLLDSWQQLRQQLVQIPTVAEIPALVLDVKKQLATVRAQLSRSGEDGAEAVAWCDHLEERLETARLRASSLVAACQELARQADRYVREMDFAFLYDQQRQVFHIGYNLESGSLDNNYYDLLASEARIASLVAIAKNDIPRSHWLHLSRPVTEVAGGRTLLSWSGTMFEYLMPPLLLQSYPGTLLNSSIYQAIARQIAYGRERHVPWGISESGFYTFDAAMNYQYRAFGVPGLGFKRGLGEDLVIAPYATLLALPFRPAAVLANMDALEERQLLGRYGFYEAVDFTPSRLPLGTDQAIVQSYMAHHQGMILLALANSLDEHRMIRRFHADQRIQSVELLLQEKIPEQPPVEQEEEEPPVPVESAETVLDLAPWTVPWRTPLPVAHYLSNGRYQLLLTNAGGGFSHWRELALTRWRPDTVQDDWGQWLYVEDEMTGDYWSAGLQPAGVIPEEGEVEFHPHKVVYRRRDGDIALELEVVVAPEDDVEIRQVRVTNHGDTARTLRLTSYAEVVLAEPGADRRHPAFAKLFVESEWLPEENALLFRRRPRAASEDPSFLGHSLLPEPGRETTGAHESDRARFLGRNRSDRRPLAVTGEQWLSGTTGATLDPVMALGQQLELEPHETVRLALITVAAETRAELGELLARYRAWSAIERAFTRAHAQAERELRRIELDTTLLEKGQQLLSLLFYPSPRGRAAGEILARNEKGQPGLWAYGISGDNPILLVQVEDDAGSELLRQLLKLHRYWRNRGLLIDLVILNEQESNYGLALQGFIHRLIRQANSADWVNRRGGLFVVNDDQIGLADRRLLLSAARVVLAADAGELDAQLPALYEQPERLPGFMVTVDPATRPPTPPLPRPGNLQFDNGYGGFSPDGREYRLYLTPGEHTPAPWINVIANPEFGFWVSEAGGGYTWAVNSGENRLTSWRNDPVGDMPAEVLYLRDEETSEIWTPTPAPAGADAPYLVRHGAGYTIFEHHSHNLSQQVRLFVAPDAPVKIVELTVQNLADSQRRLTATYYAELVLGTGRDTTQQYLIPEYAEAQNGLLVRNPYNVEFADRVAFLASSKEPHSLTTDRDEFLGRLRTLRRPAALERIGMEDRVAPGLDPCAAIQVHIDLAAGARETMYFLLGQGADRAESVQLLARFQDQAEVAAAWEANRQQWAEILEQIQVETPDQGLDLLLNRWLLYQALSCRIWGRSALYQSSGAYGFRDQLQDVLSLLHSRPDLAREQIVRAARHQFEAGDVLHWWHPPSGRGVRTLIRDDLLWLPFATAHYVAVTGDRSLLAEAAPFLQGEPLADGEEERYGYYEATTEQYTVFEHCRRALDRGSTQGRHGLPLMGGGDWNDGMNRVGIEGEGESIWLGWFLYDTLSRFAALCDEEGRTALAETYRERAEAYREALEINGWDGDWYRRAYYDDGTPLGSRESEECQIDAIAQSWSVLSGAARPARARRAMSAVDERLVREDERLLLLFTPPFDDTPRDPGYIKGYLPGIRENGGQYTHAALWTIWAFAELGQGGKAADLFRLTNPIYRADTREKADHYHVEPYVIVADVYGVPPHTGRGGWSWYTGSSGWMYRLGVEALLGVRRAGEHLWLEPRIPAEWPGYRLTYRYGASCYEIVVENPQGVEQGVLSVTLDGRRLPATAQKILLVDDGAVHKVTIQMGA